MIERDWRKRSTSFICAAIIMVLSAQTVSAATNETVESVVRKTYADVPVLIEIARCESKFRHYGTDGAVLRSGYGDSIIGVMQLHMTYHSAAATAKGFDLTNLGDHLAYARYLYDEEGTTPWNGSRACWQNATNAITSVTVTQNRAVIERQIALLMIEVYKLQIQLLTLQLAALNTSE